MHYLTILAVRSVTIPGKFIRLVTKAKYNHISVTLDDNYNTLYSFARKNKYTPLDGGFVIEKPSFYSLGKNIDVKVKVFKIPITNDNVNKFNTIISKIANDPEYMYNFYAALLCFLNLGFATYKAYYCSEFAAYIIKECTNIELAKPTYKYSPKDIINLLNDYLSYEGYISKLTNIVKQDESFYNKIPILSRIRITIKNLIVLAKRRG